jgi:biotin carboxyl carrier protein
MMPKRKPLLIVTLALVLMLSGFGWYAAQCLVRMVSDTPLDHFVAQAADVKYTCGMHPMVITDEPGNCPICGMELTPLKTGTGAGSDQPAGERKIKYWQAPMDPTYIRDEPGKSPMGMDLIPVHEDESPGGSMISRGIPSGWRNSTMPHQRLTLQSRDDEVALTYQIQRDGDYEVNVEDTMLRVRVFACGDGQVDLAIDDRRLQFNVRASGASWFVHGPAGACELLQRSRYPATGGQDSGGGLTAPMPGAVLEVEAKPGDQVRKGQLLLILEAMKMEHRITAPFDGTIDAVHVSAGHQVENGQLLVTLVEADSSESS